MRPARALAVLPQRWHSLVPQRWHALSQELAKFGTIGVANLVINFAVFNLLALTVLPDGQLKAKASATVVATTCAYFMNRHWTYRDRPKSTLHREYTLFFFFNLVGLVIEVAVVGLAKYGLGITHLAVLNLFTAVGIALGTAFRFWSYRTHVFRAAPGTEPEADPITAESVADGPEAGIDEDLAGPEGADLAHPAGQADRTAMITVRLVDEPVRTTG